jgi:adenosylmethionine-8-amino-7-oxononanoate aminotransferase
MPFTSNKDFKANPRLITEAKGVYLKHIMAKHKLMQAQDYFVIH